MYDVAAVPNILTLHCHAREKRPLVDLYGIILKTDQGKRGLGIV